MGQLRVVRAEGDPNARGQQVGRELRDLVNESVDFYHRYLARRGLGSQRLQDLLTPYLVAAETHFPALMATLKGMSVGATVPVLELFAINAFEELEPMLEAPEGAPLFLQRKEGYVTPPDHVERCSSFTVTGPEATILAHNEHWLAGDIGNVAVVIDVSGDRPVRLASPTIVCCLPAVGVNSHGVAQGIGSLTASDDGVGVPRVIVSRNSLEALDRSDAIARAGLAARAGGYGHVFAFAGGDAMTVETTRTKLAVLDGPGPHTNHYLDPGLAELGPAPSEGSRARLDRLEQLLGERQPRTAPEVMDILRDHGSSPQSICLHPDPQEVDEASAVVFSMVAELEEGRMWVAPGNPCEVGYEEVDLTGVL